MKLITAVIRPERLRDVEAALFGIGVTGMMLTRVDGYRGERDGGARYPDDAAVPEPRAEIRLEMACAEPFVEPCIEAILSAARTGEVGDGRIFVQPLETVVRIRTGERDDSALATSSDDVLRRARAQLQDTLAWNTAEQGP